MDESAEKRPWWHMPKMNKEQLAALGFGAFSAYGVISNVNAGILITIAWLTVVKATGAMPTAPGNWPTFLGVYAGGYRYGTRMDGHGQQRLGIGSVRGGV